MVKVKSQTQIEQNYRNSAGKAGTNYAAAIDGIVWQGEALEGQDLYVQQMQNPEVLNRRASGIAKVSDSEFKRALREKGAPVIAGRMTAASGKMAQNFAPYRAALEGVSLPPRSADPMQNVDNRVKPIVQAMVDTKKSMG